jgi:predicted metal-dependent HD superfamily phosphohydrolase
VNNSIHELGKIWSLDVAQLPVAQAIKDKIFNNIISRHSERGRRYHGVGHLVALFDILKDYTHSVQNPTPLHYAIWWHDSVYDPMKTNNEERSAELAVTHFDALGVNQETAKSVSKLILATKNHWQPLSFGEGDYFLDADIAILGAPADIYDAYARNVRAEYSMIPDEFYYEGRNNFLESALSVDKFFRTHEFQRKFSDAARLNLQRELNSIWQRLS